MLFRVESMTVATKTWEGRSQRSRRHRAVLELVAHVNEGWSLPRVMNSAVENVRDLLEIQKVKVLERLRTEDSLAVRAASGEGGSVTPGSRLDVGTRVQAGLTLMSNGLVTVDDFDSDDGGSSLLRENGIVGGISTVLRNRLGLFGVFEAQDREHHRQFSEDDRILFESVALVLSVAIELHVLRARVEQQEGLLAIHGIPETNEGARVNRADVEISLQSPNVVEVRSLRIDLVRRSLMVEGEPLELPPMETALLIELAMEPGRLIPAEELGRRAWPQSPYSTAEDVRRHVYRLRKALGDQRRKRPLIRNRRGFGYMLDDRESA